MNRGHDENRGNGGVLGTSRRGKDASYCVVVRKRELKPDYPTFFASLRMFVQRFFKGCRPALELIADGTMRNTKWTLHASLFSYGEHVTDLIPLKDGVPSANDLTERRAEELKKCAKRHANRILKHFVLLRRFPVCMSSESL